MMAKIQDFIMSREFVRNYIMDKAREKVTKQTGGLYPAPLRILEVLKTGLAQGEVAGYEAEATAFGQLSQTRESKALVGLYHGQVACKKNRFGASQTPVK